MRPGLGATLSLAGNVDAAKSHLPEASELAQAALGPAHANALTVKRLLLEVE